MGRSFKRIPLAATVTILGAAAAVAMQLVAARLPDLRMERSVAGVPVTFTGKIDVGADVHLSTSSLIRIHVVVDMGDLQRKLPAIVATLKLPSDNCASFSSNNPIVTLTNTRIDADAGHATFHTDGALAMWDCRENPVPKVEMHGLEIRTSPGDPFKNKLGTQPFSMDVPFGAAVADGGHARIAPGTASVTLGGPYVEITRRILAGFKVDLDGKLNEAIGKAFDPEVATAAIPKEYLDAGVVLDEAAFVLIPGSQTLGLDVRGSAKPSLRLAKQLADFLVRRAEGRD